MKKSILSAIWTIAILMAYVPVCLAWGSEITVTPTPVGGVAPTVNSILGVIQWIGFIVAIGMLIYVGIKYLTAGAGTKAEVKSNLVPMLIGAVLVALGPTIAKAVFDALAPQGNG